jgi:hypothetical protein
LIEAIPKSSDDLEFLRTLDETVPEDVLDFWATPVKAEEPVPILVHPDLLPHVEEAFQVPMYLTCARSLPVEWSTVRCFTPVSSGQITYSIDNRGNIKNT